MAVVPPFQPLPLPTLNLYGVPIDPNGTGVGNGGLGVLMPKLKHRFQIIVTGFGSNTPDQTTVFTRQVVTCGRPNINYNETPLHSYNNIVYIAQKPEWQTIELTLRDDITNGITSAVSTQLQKQMNHFNQSAAAAGSNYKFEMFINTLDGNSGSAFPTAIEQWYLEGCYITQAQYDSLDYASSDPVMITLTLRYDNATQGDEAALSAVYPTKGITSPNA